MNEAREFLCAVREKRLEALAERARLDELRRRAESVPGSYELFMQGAAESAATLKAAVKKQEEAFASAQNEAWLAEQAAEALITSAKSLRERTILRLRYLSGMTWSEIAQFFEDTEQPICERHIFRIHNAAISSLLNETRSGLSAKDL